MFWGILQLIRSRHNQSESRTRTTNTIETAVRKQYGKFLVNLVYYALFLQCRLKCVYSALTPRLCLYFSHTFPNN